MQMLYLILTIILLTSCSAKEQTFNGDYYFILTDGEVTKLSQSNDTLYEYKCYSDRPCIEIPSSHYKVLGIKIEKSSFIFKLEKLDTLQLPKRYPDNRYSILVLKIIDSERISFIQQLFGLSKKQVTTNFIDTFNTDKKFGFTFFSSNYYNNLKKLKTITSKSEVEEITALFKTEKFIEIVDLYKISHPPDMYASGLSAELFNQACIDKGYNPIGAGRIANQLMRK